MKKLDFQKQFVSKINDGTKKHTLRVDLKNRINENTFLSFVYWEGKADFSKSVSFKDVTKVVSVQQVELHYLFNEFKWISIDGRFLLPGELIKFVKNDGFDSLDEFIKFFGSLANFKYKLIHWTDLRY